MQDEISVRQWQERFQAGDFASKGIMLGSKFSWVGSCHKGTTPLVQFNIIVLVRVL